MEIRKICEMDLEAIRNICRSCSPEFPASDDVLLNMYCNYYIEKEPEHCLVLSDENQKAAGYLIASFDWEEYSERFYLEYMPVLKRCSPDFAAAKIAEDEFQAEIMSGYPAHFHIDILEPYRGRGFGSKLIRKIIDIAETENVKGIMLGVGADNTGAQNFYRKNGFEFLKGNENVKFFGRKLSAYKDI